MNDQNEQLGKETWPTVNYSFVLPQLKADIVLLQTEMIIQNFCLYRIFACHVSYS